MFSLQPPRHIPTLPIASVPQFGLSPLLAEPDMTVGTGSAEIDPGCVKTLRGINTPEILRLVATLRAKKTQKFVFRSA